MNSTDETLRLVRQILASAGNAAELAKATFSQPGSATTGLQTYDLEAPAKNLVPFLSPLRNRIPRMSGRGGIQANWKAVTNVTAGGMPIGVSEGLRAGSLVPSSSDVFAAYRTLGLESSVTVEAELAAEGFDDLRARAVSTLLEQTMVEEEYVILGGNATHALGVTPTPSLTTTTTGGAIGATVAMSVICMALTVEGFRLQTVATGITQVFARSNADGTTTNINGGCAQKSANGTVTTGAGTTNSVTAVLTPVRGAYAYAWFWGAAGSETLGAITNVSQVVITTAAGGGQAASALTATDYSQNTTIHDGLLGFCGNSALNSYYAAATAGATLTPDGAGGIVELDAALQYFYDTLRLTPATILMSSQEAQTIKKIVHQQGTATSLARFNFNRDGRGIVAGAIATGYLNPFANGLELSLETHPYMPKGTVLFLTEKLPYPMNNVTNIMQIRARRDYYQYEWPLRTRQYEYGVYTDQVLQHYFPASMGIITNLSKA